MGEQFEPEIFTLEKTQQLQQLLSEWNFTEQAEMLEDLPNELQQALHEVDSEGLKLLSDTATYTCEDRRKSGWCERSQRFCSYSYLKARMRRYCRKTCGYCRSGNNLMQSGSNAVKEQSEPEIFTLEK